MKTKKTKKILISLTLVLVLALTVLTACQTGGKGPLESNLADTAGIRLEQAKQIALANARLAAAQVTFTGTALKTVDGSEVYALRFETDSYSYDYDIAADNGTIIDTAKKAREGDFISADQARQLALADAGLVLEDVTFSKTKLDRDDEKVIYELEFASQDYSYDYDIDATSGQVLEGEKKPRQAAGETSLAEGTEMIGETMAKQIALADAGLPEKAVTIKKTSQKKDDGREIYEVEFYTDTHEFDYDLDAYSGMIISAEKEQRKTMLSTTQRETKNTTTRTTTRTTTKATNKTTTTKGTTAGSQETQKPSSYLGEAKAKEIALKDAGFTASHVNSLTVELKTKNVPVYYEVEFRTATYKYEYEIEATNGTLLEMEKERLKKESGASGSNYIDESRAKEIALKDAGLAASDVRFTEVELEIKGTKAKYEIEFISGQYEYDYDIDARTGDILEMEKELLRKR